MDIYISPWLIYLVNLLSTINFSLIAAIILLSVAFLAFIPPKDTRYYDYRINKKTDVYIGIGCLISAIVCLIALTFIPSKETAINIISINYINKSNTPLNDSSVAALKDNIYKIIDSGVVKNKTDNHDHNN